MTVGLEVMTGTMNASALSALFPRLAQGAIFNQLPIGGVVIGALTALTAPFLWPIMIDLCWDENTKKLLLNGDTLWLVDLYQYIAIPVGLPVGILAGLSMHLVSIDSLF
jgi:hypothetical protein